jgi:nitroimidazol reductase NimA-like FMN-containing flavoprotein (pyridoxamine 5'-phosphate oxidase superfamily)
MTTLWNSSVALEAAECMRLLSVARLGRVGFTSAVGPQVLPVNHTVLDGSIVFRTELYSSLADATRAGTVAFEADELDDRMRSGWSVLVVGQAAHVEDFGDMEDVFRRMGQPWAPGSRPLVARILPSQVTGRRFERA